MNWVLHQSTCTAHSNGHNMLGDIKVNKTASSHPLMASSACECHVNHTSTTYSIISLLKALQSSPFLYMKMFMFVNLENLNQS